MCSCIMADLIGQISEQPIKLRKDTLNVRRRRVGIRDYTLPIYWVISQLSLTSWTSWDWVDIVFE